MLVYIRENLVVSTDASSIVKVAVGLYKRKSSSIYRFLQVVKVAVGLYKRKSSSIYRCLQVVKVAVGLYKRKSSSIYRYLQHGQGSCWFI